VTSSCIQNAQYACPNRFFGTITVTGGYPNYAQSKGLSVPPYLIGIDKTYTPTTYGKEMSSYVALGSSATYVSTTGQNIGVKTEDDGNCTTYPFALDVAAFAAPSDCNMSITGTVYNDTNGGTIDGTPINNPSGQQLYVYLYSNVGVGETPCIVAKATVQSDGTYSFSGNFAPNNYAVYLSTNGSLSIGTTPPPPTVLPNAPSGNPWMHTAEGLTNAGDGSANGIIGTLNITGFGTTNNVDFAIQPPVIFPVTLVNFEGQWAGAKTILSWKTESELNSAHFVLEYSINGANYEAVAQLNAAGNSNTPRNYAHTHDFPTADRNYYRLKMVDIDGYSAYSNVVLLSKYNQLPSLTLFPNPAQGKVTVLHPSGNQKAILTIVESTGKLVKTIQTEANTVQTEVDLSGITSGVYQVIWQNGKQNLLQKLVVY
ncbi:MAG: T9SS type A sorting domain-containing protein, partial [Bacteroidia bacterium]